MTQAAPLYEARNISKKYGSVVALENVDFAVRAGEVVGLVGDNGAGKSTLIKVLSGVHKPDSGELLLEGERVEWESPAQALESGIETLYQDAGLCPHLTVSANVFLGRELTKKGILGALGFLDNKKMDKEAHAELARVGIAVPGSERTVAELSGGQRQAVAIGRAVAWASKVILLDEPTNHLGARQSEEVLEVVEQAKKNDLGVVFISHTLPHVLEVCDRIVVLRLGQVVADAPRSEFDRNSLVSAITGFVGAGR
ncbi:MAG: ATP-binding cassette domain-containing protein [Scrofimicrobium sp.]